MNNPDFENILELKPELSYGKNVLKEVNRLAIKKNNAKIFGSYIYRYQKFPGDIDILEEIKTTSKEKTIKLFSDRIKKIVRNIKKEKNHYYSEIKCGIDEVYGIKVGYLKEGIFYIDSKAFDRIHELNDLKLLEQEDFDILIKILKNRSSTQDAWDLVIKLLRKYLVLRWTATEILQGKKKLRGNRIITLEKALTYSTLVKIDEITLINGNFIEITNTYLLEYIDKEGNEQKFSSTSNPNLLTLEIEKLYYSNLWFSSFKMLKRMYSFCRYIVLKQSYEHFDEYDHFMKVLRLITPILSGNISLLYQIKSELDTLILIMRLYGHREVKNINFQLDNTKNRLTNVTEIDMDSLLEFLNDINDIIKSKDNDKRIEILESLVDKFVDVINYYTIKYITENQINPPPKITLPSQIRDITELEWPNEILYTKKYAKMYDYSIVRSPVDVPFEEFEENINKILEN